MSSAFRFTVRLCIFAHIVIQSRFFLISALVTVDSDDFAFQLINTLIKLFNNAAGFLPESAHHADGISQADVISISSIQTNHIAIGAVIFRDAVSLSCLVGVKARACVVGNASGIA